MIEVEIKVAGQEDNIKKLIEDAEFINRSNIRDEYYDYDDFRLAVSEKWLRNRNGNFELKISILADDFGDRVADQYHELETEQEIADALKIPVTESLEHSLETAGIKPYTTIVTDRETYKLEDFTITVDHLDFDYPLAEIELLVHEEDEVPQAEQRIIAVAKKYGLAHEGQSAGKNIAHARKHHPELITALVKAGKLEK